MLNAQRLLRDPRVRQMLGEARCAELEKNGYIELPSKRYPRRKYRQLGNGTLHYWDLKDGPAHAFGHWLCIHLAETKDPIEDFLMRYLLVTTDEDRLLARANAHLDPPTPAAVSRAEDFRLQAIRRLRVRQELRQAEVARLRPHLAEVERGIRRDLVRSVRR